LRDTLLVGFLQTELLAAGVEIANAAWITEIVTGVDDAMLAILRGTGCAPELMARPVIGSHRAPHAAIVDVSEATLQPTRGTARPLPTPAKAAL
jgi:hypothetical protein